MYYYLSFLRPPPTHTYPSTPSIKITPQIANDLRTEQFPHPQDIFYSWLLVSPTPKATQARKLTTWRPEGAYKEIPVPLPPNVKDGQEWRLLLTPTPGVGGMDLDKDTGGVLPVLSMPILFSKGVGGKQERIERVYRFHVRDEVRKMRMVEQTSFDLDKKIWDSGIGLSSWLIGFASAPEEKEEEEEEEGRLDDLKTVVLSGEGKRFVELGTGIGIVALTLCTIRSALLTPETAEHEKVYATDVESAMPLLEENITTNASLYPFSVPQAKVLDWDDKELPEYVNEMQGVDLIVMADVTYNTASFPSLLRTLNSLINLSPEPPLILMGCKERDVGEREMWDLASNMGIDLERVGERRGWGEREVEVWVGRVRK